LKIYTKGGDNGSTSLIGGRRVSKNHPKIEAYGTIDELMAHIALLKDTYQNDNSEELFLWILDRLMTISSLMAADFMDDNIALPKLFDDDILRLEKEIDEIESKLKPLNSFVLPGGSVAVSQCHVARTVCRRAERLSLGMMEEVGFENLIIKFLNRLSDFLFVFSRLIVNEQKLKEIRWDPKL
jgi:cob(I)alamin adenosyltransferase